MEYVWSRVKSLNIFDQYSKYVGLQRVCLYISALETVVIRIGRHGDATMNPLCRAQAIDTTETSTNVTIFRCDHTLCGTYLSIHLSQERSLVLCEVKVYRECGK